MTDTRDPAKTQRAMEKARAKGRACASDLQPLAGEVPREAGRRGPLAAGERLATRMKPVVQRSQCEGKADCLAVCPYNVFEIGPIDEAEYRAMSFFTRMKLWAHGKQTAYTPNADACHACGLCVEACPEQAITLVAA